ncbi:MAG: hypothetical protein U5K30_12890 [Acidimicrobiales bacterium]|nr:hypothetical protein [Acidimicrobiales bacterium]
MSDQGEHQERPGQSPYAAPQVESVLREIRDLIEQARPMPVSRSVMINQAEVLDLIDEAAERLPEELRAAKWLLKQREEFLARTRREADEIIEAAREEADELVTETEVVKAAEARARSVVDAADAEARRLKLEAEDFCDQRLASFEIVLERTMKVVNAGRVKLQGGQAREEDDDRGGSGGHGGGGGHGIVGDLSTSGSEETFGRPHLEAVPDEAPAFFDQDES